MIYVAYLDIPADTKEEAPISTDLEIKERMITRVEFHFPDGCCGMARVRIRSGVKVLWPQPEEEWIDGNDETIEIPEHYRLPELPDILTIEGCSPGASYGHRVSVRIFTLPEEAARPWQPVREFVSMLKKLFT